MTKSINANKMKAVAIHKDGLVEFSGEIDKVLAGDGFVSYAIYIPAIECTVHVTTDRYDIQIIDEIIPTTPILLIH